MEIKTNGDYNRCQLNETINLSPDGKVLSKSLMLNLRGETTEEVWKSYQELKRLIEGKEERPARKTKKEKKTNQKEQKEDNPGICPKCGAPMVEKQGISSKNMKPYHFFSCSAWPICDFSKPFLTEAEKNIPCDQDLIAVENIPF